MQYDGDPLGKKTTRMKTYHWIVVGIAIIIPALAGCASAAPDDPFWTDIPTPSPTSPQLIASPPPNTPTPEFERSLMQVQGVDVRLLSAAPTEVEIAVTGVLGDACTEFDSFEETHDGDQVRLTLWARRPTNMICAQILRVYERVMRLDGVFPPGDYALIANDFETRFTVPARGDEEPVVGLAFVDDVQVLVMESFPAQVTLAVSGWLPDGCTEIDQISQSRDGNTIRVTITTRRPAGVFCTQAIELFTRDVRLEGTFLPGDYTADVNGLLVEFHID